jgi:D-alanyl-lipoteichoic acid acyltransferase DltB (MBOAT superfamily)
MLFNSYIFIFLFFPLAIIGYYILRYRRLDKLATGFLIFMSMWFYGYNSIKYLAILIISIILNYIIVEFMYRFNGKMVIIKKLFFIVGILLNIGILFYFKYYDFFIENVNTIFKTGYGFLGLTLPLGISFYTFQQLSYVIDSYRGQSEKYSLLEYGAYVSFFPQLIAGPIVYHNELIPQLRDKKNHRLNYENLSRGIYTFALGLAKKVLIADTFSKVVNIGYNSIYDLNTVSVVVVMVCYSLQIYFDFSGYCDMASGIGYMFNIELPINFNSPYKAASISEFWDRWHMTLTRFFTKYVYIPLGGSRRGKLRTYVNVLIVFFVSGVWHGANWTFILWGVINGLGNIFDKLFGRFFKWVPRAVGVILTFIFVTFAWSLFRADSIAQAVTLWGRLKVTGNMQVFEPATEAFNNLIEVKLLCRAGFGTLVAANPSIPLVVFIVAVLLGCFFMRNTQEKASASKYGTGRMAVTVILMMWSILSLSDVSEFLYFNF